MPDETWLTKEPCPTLYTTSQASGWLLFVPTQAPEGGFYARVRLSHTSGEVFATCSDAEGVWVRHFFDIENYIEWLDGIADGLIQPMPAAMPLPRTGKNFKDLAA